MVAKKISFLMIALLLCTQLVVAHESTQQQPSPNQGRPWWYHGIKIGFHAAGVWYSFNMKRNHTFQPIPGTKNLQSISNDTIEVKNLCMSIILHTLGASTPCFYHSFFEKPTIKSRFVAALTTWKASVLHSLGMGCIIMLGATHKYGMFIDPTIQGENVAHINGQSFDPIKRTLYVITFSSLGLFFHYVGYRFNENSYLPDQKKLKIIMNEDLKKTGGNGLKEEIKNHSKKNTN